MDCTGISGCLQLRWQCQCYIPVFGRNRCPVIKKEPSLRYNGLNISIPLKLFLNSFCCTETLECADRLKRNNPEVHFHNYVLVPSPAAWLALFRREGWEGRKWREINSSAETAPTAFFSPPSKRAMDRDCERDTLAPVAMVSAWANSKRCCTMSKLLYYLPRRLRQTSVRSWCQS